MAFKLGAKSLRELDGVHPSLVAVVKRAIELTTQDFTVFDGARTVAEQQKEIDEGDSSLKNPLSSKHVDPDGSGPKKARAVDLVPWINGGPRWEPLSAFAPIAVAMKQAAKELNVPLTYGGEWKTFKDYPHWELKAGWEPKSAPATPGTDAATVPPKPGSAAGQGSAPLPEATTITHRDVKKTGKQMGLIGFLAAVLGAIVTKVLGLW